MYATIRELTEAVGILSFAITGMIVAREKGANAVATFLVALFAGLGGGTVRDVMLDVRPFLWEQRAFYPEAIFLLTMGYVIWPRAQRYFSQPRNLGFAVVEVLAVASLGIAGADKADSLGQHWLMVVIYGVISGAFGGVVRDVLMNELPALFKAAVWLAEALFIGCVAFVGLGLIGVDAHLASAIGAALIIGIRLTAIVRERRKASAQAQQTAPLPAPP